MKRFTIYFHYDGQGILDTPCRLAAQAFRQVSQGMLLVSNGVLATESRSWVNQAGIPVLERLNSGLDVGAYRQALQTVGREVLAGFDELVLVNYTLAGPLGNLEDLFARMDARTELDFWGLTRHYPMKSRRFGGQVPEHLQSHFLAVRGRMLHSDAFWSYWQNMKEPATYEQSVMLHETRFTSEFAALGYCWDTAVDTQDLREVFVNPIMACPAELLRRGCPFFKRRSFFTDFEEELRRTDGTAARELYDYLKENTGYPVDALVQSLLRTQPLHALAQNLHWNTVLPRESGPLEGLSVVRLPIDCEVQPLRWYLEQRAVWAQEQLSRAATLFARDPLLGAAAPALPLLPRTERWAARQWKAAQPLLKSAGLTVPWEDTVPPPAAGAGWFLVRDCAFPQGVPQNSWLLPLAAQQNGYTTVTFMPESAAAAQGDLLAVYARAANRPAAVAKQLARLARDAGKRKA